MLPILHLNGYKIANPTILARHAACRIGGAAHGLWLCAASSSKATIPKIMHPEMAAAFDKAFDDIAAIQKRARNGGVFQRPIWPMIVLRTPKGWAGPKTVDGLKTEGFWRAHQVPFTLEKPEHLKLLESWMRSYRPEELFDRHRQARARDRRPGAQRRAAHERQSPCQWRRA